MALVKKQTVSGTYWHRQEYTKKVDFSWKKDMTPERLNEYYASKTTAEGYISLEDDTFVETASFGDPESPEPPPFGLYDYRSSSSYSTPDRLIPRTPRTGEIYLPSSHLDIVTADINKFLANKAIYKELGAMYRRGYLLHGPPGNGKTVLIRQIAQSLPDSYIIWLAGIPEHEFCEELNDLSGTKVCVLEEISGENDNFRSSELLEFLDGESSLKDCITIATTNYPEKLKENLANRPSRFDVVFEVSNPTKEIGNAFLSKFLNEPVDFFSENLSFAQLKEIALLHRLHGITLSQAHARLMNHKEAFKRGFAEVKKFGF